MAENVVSPHLDSSSSAPHKDEKRRTVESGMTGAHVAIAAGVIAVLCAAAYLGLPRSKGAEDQMRRALEHVAALQAELADVRDLVMRGQAHCNSQIGMLRLSIWGGAAPSPPVLQAGPIPAK